jgi:hypothetical protein
MSKKLSCREVLRLTGAAAGATLLAAFVPQVLPKPVYTVTNFDTAEAFTVDGQEHLTKGLTVQLRQPRDAALIRYQREKT